MPNWQDLVEKVRTTPDHNRWTFTTTGEADYASDSGTFHVVINTDLQDPEWKQRRARAALAGSAASFAVWHEIGAIRNDKKCLRNFARQWYRMWVAGCCPSTAVVPELVIMKPIPPKIFALPTVPLRNGEREFFRDTRLYSTSLGMLFGQEAASLCEPTIHVTGRYTCPFCEQESTTGYKGYHIREEDVEHLEYFSDERALLACCNCDRVLDATS